MPTPNTILLCASLEVLVPSAFAVKGVCCTQAFLTWHEPLIGFLNLSAPFPPWPFGFISPRNALGIFLQSFLLQEIGFLFRGSCPLAFGCFAFVDAIFEWFRVPQRICSLASGFCTLLKLVHIDSVVSLFYGRCSPGFHSSSGVSYSFVLRSPQVDLLGCSTSTTSRALLRFSRQDLAWCCCLSAIPLLRPTRAPSLRLSPLRLGHLLLCLSARLLLTFAGSSLCFPFY